ncbi:hypothetical protein JCM10212_002286 [Sporobolomyces blumeae]
MSSSPRSASPVPSPSLALHLPAEIWFMILNQLDYAQLRKAARICKLVQRYTRDSTFDAVLFRGRPPIPPLAPNATVTLHPVLHDLDCVFTDLENARFLRIGSHPLPRALDYPATLREQATSPASTTVIMHHLVGKPISTKAKNGVTVLGVLKAIAKFCSRMDPSAPCTDGCPNCGRGCLEWQDVMDAECWSGWHKIQSEGENRTTLVADDSYMHEVAGEMHG